MKRVFNGDYKVTQKYHEGHKGIDIVGISSQLVISPVSGVVRSSTMIPKSSGDITWEWGNYVRVDDTQGNRYYFCHLKSRNVKVGDTVQVGDVLGVMGNTGKSFGAHLHLEVRTESNTRVNPANYLDIPNEKGVYKWVKKSRGWTYGAFSNRWGYIDSKWYYFDSNGYLVTGLKVINDKSYYFSSKTYNNISEGQMLLTNSKGEII